MQGWIYQAKENTNCMLGGDHNALTVGMRKKRRLDNILERVQRRNHKFLMNRRRGLLEIGKSEAEIQESEQIFREQQILLEKQFPDLFGVVEDDDDA
jgi:hypothetical protein